MGPVKPGPSDKTATPAHVGGVSKVRRDSSASIHNITQLCNDLTISSPRVGRIKNRNLPRGTRSISSYFSPTRARQASSNNQASNQPVQADNAQCNVDTQSSQPAPAPTAELSKNCVAEVARQVPGTQVLTPATERAPRVDKTAPRSDPPAHVNDLNNVGDQNNQNEIFSLVDFIEPKLPNLQQENGTIFADNWHEIDHVTLEDCLLSLSPSMGEVPNQHKHQFAKAFETCFLRFKSASEEGNEKDTERALKWFLALPHMLLTTPTRGGKAGHQIVKKRFDCIVEENYSKLINVSGQEREVVTQKNMRRRQAATNKEQDPLAKTRNAISLISRGMISKAANRMKSYGVVNLNNPASKKALMLKYPERSREVQQTVTKGAPVDSFRGLKFALLSLKGGVAPGTGGLRPEFLTTLAEVWDEKTEIWELINHFCMEYATGGMPPWFYQAVMTVETVGLYKTAERDPEKLRPIGMRNPFFKTLHKEIISQNREAFKEFLEPQQLGMSVSGAAKLVNSVRMVLEQNTSFICVKLDFRNAFNEASRARVVEALEEVDSLKHLAQFAGMVLTPVSGLESGGSIWGKAGEGQTQGDPLSGPFFCVTIQKDVVKADNRLSQCGGMVRAGWDDAYFVGPKTEVFSALDEFKTEVNRKAGLVLQVTKSEVFSTSGEMPPEAPAGFVNAGTMVQDQFQPGFLCYGVPVGTDEYVLNMLDSKISELEEEVENMCSTLESSRQSMWAMLRSSTSQKLDYWLTLVYPSLMKPAAEKMDKLVLRVIQKIVGSEIPMKGGDEDWNKSISVPIEILSDRSFQNWALRLPIRLGGLGIRSCVETSPAAFIGGIEQSLPHFTKHGGVCLQLKEVIGSFEESNSRWQTLIESGSRTGVEFQHSWNSLKEEVDQCYTFLNKDNELNPLKDSAEGAGKGREDGGTRRAIVQHREEVREAVLRETLSRQQRSNNRHLLAWTNRDKLSTAWLQCLPGPEGFSNAEFSEAMALVLCMPSPSCKERVGEKVGKAVVDKFGDNIMSQHLPGDHWRIRHDKIKMKINSMCSWARVPATVEVWGLFSHLIPAEALSRMESGRARQAIVPDFRLNVPSDLGESQVKLAELKVLNCCKTWYTTGSGVNVRATDKRANGLQSIYKSKAKKVDKDIGTAAGERGPVERKLDEYGDIMGLCFGAWGEGSKDVHELVDVIAKSRLKHQLLDEGRPDEGSDNELALITGQVRRMLSQTAVKAQVSCLLSRIHQVGPGNKQIAKKRQWALQQDEKMRKERSAQWIRRIEGVNTLRKGMIRSFG